MRNKRLDVLRCVAVILVIFHHGEIVNSASRAGWIGVDLFFVLSGFLISGLLFDEYRKKGFIRFKRFLYRRAFKIYPAFYVFLAFTAFIEYFTHQLAPLSKFRHEVFFVQSYWPGIWPYTWSLAVEEHFYILLPLFLFTLMRFSSNRADPFRIVPGAFLSVAALCQISRAVSAFSSHPNFDRVFFATHNRIDSLFFGVLIGYFYHFRIETLQRLMRPAWNRVVIVACSVAFLSCAYWFDRHTWFFGLMGYVLIYLGCRGILLLTLFVRDVLPQTMAVVIKPIGTIFARVGMYSYSIYLWHGAVGAYLLGSVHRRLHIFLGPYQSFTFFLIASLAVGIFMSVLIEFPIIRIRNRFFPSSVHVLPNVDPRTASTQVVQVSLSVP